LDAMRNEFINPCSLSCGRTSDNQPGICTLDRASRHIIEFEICGVFGIARPEIDVGLIPYFKVPVRDFFLSVSIYKVFAEVVDKVIPLSPVFRWRNDWF